MTRSEERLNVGTESVPADRARLRRYVVTEHLSGADITEDEHEVQLRAGRPVVTKETVPSNE